MSTTAWSEQIRIAAAVRSSPGIGLVEVLDRIERAARVSPQSALLWRDGLQHMSDPLPSLELALLELYGPLNVRNPARGLMRLTALAEQESGALGPDAGRLVAFLVAQGESMLDLHRQHDEIERQLEQERVAHELTRERLEALRRIERDLEAREAQPMEPDR